MPSFASVVRVWTQALARLWRLGTAARVLLLAAVAFIPGWLLPILTSDALGRAAESYSIVEGVGALLLAGSWGLGLLILGFSVVFPAGKLWLLLRYAQRRQLPIHRRWLLILGKWSMLDVLVVAIIIGAGRLRMLSDFSSEVGVYWFGLAVVLSVVGAEMLLGQGGAPPPKSLNRRTRWGLGALALIALGTLLTGLATPLMTVSKWLFWDNDYSLLAVLPQMIDAGEYLLPVVLGTTVMAAPAAATLLIAGYAASGSASLLGWVERLQHWSLLGVFVLALLIVMAKLAGPLEVTPRFGLWMLTAGAALSLAASSWLWRAVGAEAEPPADGA